MARYSRFALCADLTEGDSLGETVETWVEIVMERHEHNRDESVAFGLQTEWLDDMRSTVRDRMGPWGYHGR